MKLLIGVDGSEAGEQALRFGLTLAQRLGAEVRVLHVIEEPPVSFWGILAGLDPEAIRVRLQLHAEETRRRVEQLAHGQGVAAAVQVREGLPAEVLLRESQGTDLIVVGTHGHKGMDRVLLGSVAERLVRESSVPVLVVRGGAAEGGGEAAHAQV